MTLSEELKQRTQARGGQRGDGRQAFLAQRREIARALKDGYPAKTVWALLHEKGTMPVQYRTFMEYVNRYLKDCEQPQPTRPPEKPPSPPLSKPKKAAKPAKKPSTKRFKFDARGKSKEELI